MSDKKKKIINNISNIHRDLIIIFHVNKIEKKLVDLLFLIIFLNKKFDQNKFSSLKLFSIKIK